MSRFQFILAVLLVVAMPIAPAGFAAQLGIDAMLVPGQSYMEFKLTDPSPQAGDRIWFDILIKEALGQSAEGAQVTLLVLPMGHPGSLTLDAAGSEAIAGDPDYWLFANSVGAGALSLGGNRYQFGDGPNNPPSAPLQNNRSLARFAFTWDGVPGFYQVSIETATQSTFLLQDFAQVAPSWTENPVTLYIPEPVTVAALILVTAVLPRRRV
jgi:hypothetical protein